MKHVADKSVVIARRAMQVVDILRSTRSATKQAYKLI